MTGKQMFIKCVEVGATIVASLFVLPFLVLFVGVTAIGAMIYIPFHLWTVVWQSVKR